MKHFKRPDDGSKEQAVKDPRIMRFCNRKKWLLGTTDSDIRYTHVDVFKKCLDLAILATAHNKVMHLDEWVDGLIKARAHRARIQKPPAALVRPVQPPGQNNDNLHGHGMAREQ